MDLASLLVGSFTGVWLRLGPGERAAYLFQQLEGWLLFFGGIMLANYLSGSYRLQYTFSRFNLVVTWLFSLIFTLFILSITSYAWFTVVLGRGVLFLSIACYSVLSLGLKILVYRSLFRSEIFLCRTAVIGTGARAAEIRGTVERELVLPAHRVVAFLVIKEPDDPVGAHHAPMDGVAVIDTPRDELESAINSLNVKLVVVGLDSEKQCSTLYPQLSRLRFHGIEILTPLSVMEIYSGRTPLDLVNEETMMRLSMDCEFPLLSRAKRTSDLVISLVAGTFLLPLGLLVALAIKCTAWRSPVVYTQMRVGQFGRPFKIFKFRTMRTDAEWESGAVWALRSDPRVTLLGRLLRRTRIDEIPQFWNVLKGDMSVVGPRPERPELVGRLAAEIPFFRERENVLPGLTGWAQIRYPYGSSVEDARRKLEYDLYYVKHLSLSFDLQIALSTLRIVIFGSDRP